MRLMPEVTQKVHVLIAVSSNCNRMQAERNFRFLQRIVGNSLTLDLVFEGDVAPVSGPSLRALATKSNTDFVVLITNDVSLTVTFVNQLLEFVVQDKVVDNAPAGVYFNSAAAGFLRERQILRPDFSPVWLKQYDYLGPVFVVRTSCLRVVESCRESPWSAFPRQIALGIFADKGVVRRVFATAYKESPRRGSSPVLNDIPVACHLDEELSDFQQQPLISIVIPSRGKFDTQRESKSLLLNAVSSIVELTTYSNYEVVVVLDEGYEQQIEASLRAILGSRLKLVNWGAAFNFSSKMNLGSSAAQGEFLLLLNDDVHLLTPSWIESMLALALIDGAGMVGALLFYEDGSVQHAGHAYVHGSPTHIGLGWRADVPGPADALRVDREVPGVTAACALISKKVFREVGGFSEKFPGNFNDVDLCLKVRSLGYQIYWTPKAKMYHFESKSRDARVHFFELDLLRNRWGHRLSDQDYWPWSPDEIV